MCKKTNCVNIHFGRMIICRRGRGPVGGGEGQWEGEGEGEGEGNCWVDGERWVDGG